MSDTKPQEQKIQIEVPQEEMQGKYANLAVITHGPNDFFLDMILLAPNTPKARVQSRIIMTPENAKQLLVALQQNIRKYEATFGEIRPKVGRNQPGPDGIIDFPLTRGKA